MLSQQLHICSSPKWFNTITDYALYGLVWSIWLTYEYLSKPEEIRAFLLQIVISRSYKTRGDHVFWSYIYIYDNCASNNQKLFFDILEKPLPPRLTAGQQTLILFIEVRILGGQHIVRWRNGRRNPTEEM